MTKLTLPEPARSVWVLTRTPLKKALERLGIPPDEQVLGGGTILSALWNHRRSRDLDWVVPDHDGIGQLNGDQDLQQAVRRWGAIPAYEKGLRIYAIQFPNLTEQPEVQIWSGPTVSDHDTRIAEVDGDRFRIRSPRRHTDGKIEARVVRERTRYHRYCRGRQARP